MKKLIAYTKQDKFTKAQQADFLVTLAQLIKNGFSLEVALDSMQLIYPHKKVILVQILQQLHSGVNLAQSLLNTGLSKTIISQIAIADVHGNLVQCLEENAMTLKTTSKNMKKILDLLAYPCFLLFSLGMLLIFLKVELAQQLPKINMNFTIKAIITGVMGLLIILVIGELWYLYKASDLVKALHQIRWPFVGNIYQDYYYYVILTATATFLKSGLSLKDILNTGRQLTSGSLQQQLAITVQKQIIKGLSLSQIIKSNKFLPAEIDMALQLGHQAPQLAIELQTIAEIKHQNLQGKIQKLINKIQPIFFILVAGLIFGTYLSILLPIYSMMKGL
ncbi:type II secretion system F family protein [Bombilactobacillus thymidiniphilus]|uniref:Type II secretion system F family protein n=1 Tax=Bombilactobacillus thymidiniphilus TaxID=2923363 RepID=A0ABY4PE17_9LACO|nr:type II secretion system F family protein [Bombilactobacillus thymidiniphilus]UQS83805.1 type II secretion system F family protein [Bombilactobacillus thymidiniphilus]